MTMNEHVATAIHDKLVSQDVTLEHAADIKQQVLCELERHSQTDLLYITKVVDHTGSPHACVTRKASTGSTELYRLDIRRLRGVARLEMIEALTIDLALNDAGTAI